MNVNIIDYLKTLRPADWEKKVTDAWTVKDVVAHLVGWEREAARELRQAWKTGRDPWFMLTENYAEFNANAVQEYSTYSPVELLHEWEKWQKELEAEIQSIGENVLRKDPRMEWIFDEGEDNHYIHHYNQIKKAVMT